MKIFPALFLCVSLVSAHSALAQESKVKWVVLPFASLPGGVPAKAGTKAASMLASELRNTEKVDVLDFKKAPPADGYSEKLEAARKKIAEGARFRSARKFRQADEALTTALNDMKAAAAGLTDTGELADAWLLLSAVQFNTGRDEEAQKSLSTALSLAPSREFPLAKTSPLFQKVVEEARKTLLSSAKGSLLIESTPSGAPVLLDSVPVGSTPVWVKEVPVGLHTFRVTLPSQEVGGGTIEVLANKQAKAAFKSSSVEPEVALWTQLSLNKVDGEALEALKRIAESTKAQALVFGALSKQGNGLTLHAFHYVVATQQIHRLPEGAFDLELLSAGMAFYEMAGKLLQGNEALGAPLKLPTPVTGKPSESARLAEVKYPLSLVGESTSEAVDGSNAASDTSATPSRRIPLKKSGR